MPEGMRRLLPTVTNQGASPAAPALASRASKYGAIATTVDGIRFDSKKEARYYEQLKLRKAAGEVSYWLRQVPLHMPGGTRYVVDFLVFFADQRRPPEYVDVKGRETAMFRVKRREIEHLFPIKVTLA
ncbi:MAG TPA: DUF1064 domain-containing protein [Pseudoxanthomonas sp.]